MKHDIIGIAGKAHAGKDTVANLLLSLFQVPTYIYHFADPIKQHLCDLLKVDIRYFNDTKLKESIYKDDLTYRMLMQNTGDSFKKIFGETVFVNIANKHYTNLKFNTSLINPTLIIPDVRYEYEAEWIKNNSGIMIYVDNMNSLTTTSNTHSSESIMIDYDIIINNNNHTLQLQHFCQVSHNIPSREAY
jgi:hypothetical protein